MPNNGYTYHDTIPRACDGMTALEYYSARHPHFTDDEWRGRIEAGQITRDGAALHAGTVIHAGDALSYFRPPWEEPEVVSEIPILYSDTRVAVFDKPDRMPVLPGGSYLEHSLVMMVRRMHGPGLAPLHRLGRGTTGAILFTRTQEAAAAFSRMMREREISKTYLALVHGTEMPDTFTIDTPIGRVPHPRLGSIHDVSPHGKPSISECTVVARRIVDDTALVRVRIPTGRTHQIRIHLASAGHPLVGDRFYRGQRETAHALSGSDPLTDAAPGSGAADDTLPGDAGYILHSWKLRYTDPFTEADTAVVAPARNEIETWLAESHAVLEGFQKPSSGMGTS